MNEPDRFSPQLRILIVDDEPDAAHLLADGLALVGHITYAAHDAGSALKLTEEFAPDVALLDLALPDLDGFELAQRLQARHGKHLVLVAVTGHYDDAHRTRATDAGFAAFVAKPARIAQLQTLIQDLTARRQPREASRPSAP
jgi:DNA-binding response OmpR family regulator